MSEQLITIFMDGVEQRLTISAAGEKIRTLTETALKHREQAIASMVRWGWLLGQVWPKIPRGQRFDWLRAHGGANRKTAYKAIQMAAKWADSRGECDEVRLLAAIDAYNAECVPMGWPRISRASRSVATADKLLAGAAGANTAVPVRAQVGLNSSKLETEHHVGQDEVNPETGFTGEEENLLLEGGVDEAWRRRREREAVAAAAARGGFVTVGELIEQGRARVADRTDETDRTDGSVAEPSAHPPTAPPVSAASASLREVSPRAQQMTFDPLYEAAVGDCNKLASALRARSLDPAVVERIRGFIAEVLDGRIS